MPDKFTYNGIPSPNGTIVPDDVFDVLMPVCSGAEFKVLAYIVRRTFGFKKESDSISLSQMGEGITKRDGKILDRGTGLSKSAVAVAIKGLVEKGIIDAHHNTSKKRGNEPTTYSLRFQERLPLSRNQTRGGLENGQGVVQKMDTQETVLQQTDLQIRNSSRDIKIDKNSSEDNRGHQSFQAIGNLLKERAKPKTVVITEIPEPLRAAVQIVSEEFGDRRHLHSNLTHVVNLAQRAGKNVDSFDQFLYQSMSITKEALQKGKVRNRMTYFFGVLEEAVGLKTLV